VRNFWLEAIIDGRKTALTGGPRSKDGGMIISLKVRDRGKGRRILNIYCSEENDVLFIDAQAGGECILAKQFKR